MKRLLLLFSFSLVISATYAQRFSEQVPQIKRYTIKEAVDPDFGITMYNKLIAPIGGDSVRYSKSGYNAQNWQEDYYVSGKLLHKGFYIDGQIKVFKNYYENGQVERNFTSTDPRHSKLEIYYEDGKERSLIEYYEGNPRNQYDFYPNGTKEYEEENSKDMEYLIKRNAYYENGSPQSIFELIDKRTKKYVKKEYYENGKVKEEGTIYYQADAGDYLKEGAWTSFNEQGNAIKTEKYHKGQLD